MKKQIATTYWVNVDENQNKQSQRGDDGKKCRGTWRSWRFSNSPGQEGLFLYLIAFHLQFFSITEIVSWPSRKLIKLNYIK